MAESVADSVLNFVYKAFTGSNYLNSGALQSDDNSQISAVHQAVKRQLQASGWQFCVNNWWWQGSCVQASENRGMYLAPHLPQNWTITSYTHYTGLHTFNVIYFTASNGKTYYWRVDNYVAATILIDYLGNSIPTWMYKTPGNSTYTGGRPGKFW